MPGGNFFEIWPLEKGRTLTSRPCAAYSKRVLWALISYFRVRHKRTMYKIAIAVL